MPTDYAGQNMNRVNAIKQTRKSLNDLDISDLDDHEISIRFLRIYGSIANSFVYIGDCLKELNDTLKGADKATSMSYIPEDD